MPCSTFRCLLGHGRMGSVHWYSQLHLRVYGKVRLKESNGETLCRSEKAKGGYSRNLQADEAGPKGKVKLFKTRARMMICVLAIKVHELQTQLHVYFCNR